MRTYTRLGVAALVIGAFAFPAPGGVPTVLFSNIAASPTSDVPGMAGVKFNPGTGTQFDRVFISPSAQHWIIGATTNQASTENEVVITGMGLTTTGSAVMAREGTPTGFDGSVNYGILGTQMDINDSGHFAFSADTTYPTTSDAVVVRWTGSWSLMAREGTQAPGQGAGIGYGTTNNAVNIDSVGNVYFRSAALTGASTQQVLYKNADIATGAVVAQTDVTSPAGQLVPPDQTIDNLTSDRYRIDGTGANYIYHGDLNGPTGSDLVMVYNGRVVAQEGVVLPGSGFASTVLNLNGDAGSQQISDNGLHYLFRGSNADTIDWVYRNGAVVAATDQPIYTGATELFDDAIFSATFFINTTNSMGDYIIGGVTNAADVSRNAVLVLNGMTEVLREGDPVDVDGNGLFDDDAYISVFNNDDSVLTDNLWYLFMADLRNGAGASLGQAFLKVRVPEPATFGLLAFAVLGLRRRSRG